MPAEQTTIRINGVAYPLVAESQLPAGERAYTRSLRPAQVSDPGRIRSAFWQIHGPIGRSREQIGLNGEPGLLAVDYVQNLETRFYGLLTSSAAVTVLDLEAADPVGATGNSLFGGFNFGDADNKFGGAIGSARISHLHEDRRYLFAHRGRIVTQINPDGWSVIEGNNRGEPVVGAAVWFAEGYCSYGSTQALQRRLSVTSGGATYSAVQISGADVLLKEMAVGNDRLWGVRADLTGANENQVRFTLDRFVSISNAFTVGDPRINAAAIGTIGPLTVVGSEVGAYGFTDAGKPFSVLPALRGHRSVNNGRKWAALGAWLYGTTDIALYALIPGAVANPTGIGSDQLKDFEGYTGRHTAIFAWRESLLDALLTPGGDTYLHEGVFNAENPPGHLDWYPLAYRLGVQVDEIHATSVLTNPTLVWGEGTDLGRLTKGRGGRDILDSNYAFSTGGGTWFGATLMRDPQKLKNLRQGRFTLENMNAGNTWQLAVSVDEGAYVNVGSAETANGSRRVLPVSGSTPLTTVNGRTLKPRLVQVAGAGSAGTTPPQVRGMLELLYDERPDIITEVQVIVVLGQQQRSRVTDLNALITRAGSGTASPNTIRLPDETTDRYGFVTHIEQVRDLRTADVQAVQLTIQVWETT